MSVSLTLSVCCLWTLLSVFTEQRPSASDLLQHEFITIGPDDDEEIFVGE